MRFAIAAALALAASSSLSAQDLSTATPIGGIWTYSATSDGSEAVFVDAYSRPQLWIHCTRPSRRVSFSKPATAAAPLLNIWTSSQTKSLPAGFNLATTRLTVTVVAYDSLLDAIANSRGRVGFWITGQPPLVVPPWAEIGRVVEDCRA